MFQSENPFYSGRNSRYIAAEQTPFTETSFIIMEHTLLKKTIETQQKAETVVEINSEEREGEIYNGWNEEDCWTTHLNLLSSKEFIHKYNAITGY